MKNKILTAAAFALLTASAFGQAANDGFVVPLDEDLTKAVVESAAPAAAAGNSSVLQGIWIETTSDSKALIRDVASGKKKGYEFDNSHFLSNANWWLWGDINKSFHLDAEIAVWDFDRTLYQANTYGANVPDVSWGDGLQSMAELFFAPLREGNDNGLGAFNKMGLTLATPYVDVKLGYGNLKANGMTHFKGIFTTIDRWNDVGDGFLEITNGKYIQEFGDFKVKALAALSEMKNVQSQPFGMYDLVDVKYADKAEVALTFGSTTSKENLFYYNKANTNAVSLYGAFNATPELKLELHGMGTFGTEIDLNADSLAYAGKVSYAGSFFGAALTGTYAAENANSVWGSDGQAYDDINADTVTGQLDFNITPVEFLTFSLDQGFKAEDTSALGDGLVNFRCQPQLDFDLNSLAGVDVTIGTYGVVNIDRLAKDVNASQNIVPYFEEAGIEVIASEVGFAKKIRFDYGTKMLYETNAASDGYDRTYFYNSLMIDADLNDKVSVHIGGLFNTLKDSDDSFIPAAVACGVKINSVPLPGRPFFWAHFTYGMNPYEDNNYSLYRADDPLNNATHRTYLLNTLDAENASRIALGLIWSL
ncbi:MAG: hypothetical protein SO116_03015 [Treponema sp.]|nr:hypothetical protein [Treponema sp.]